MSRPNLPSPVQDATRHAAAVAGACSSTDSSSSATLTGDDEIAPWTWMLSPACVGVPLHLTPMLLTPSVIGSNGTEVTGDDRGATISQPASEEAAPWPGGRPEC